MNKIIILQLTILLGSALAKDLEFQKIFFNRDNTEISSLFLKDNKLLFVADKLSNRSIYQVKFEKDKFHYKDYINLSELKGHNKYFKEVILNIDKSHKLISPFDLEGITACGDTFYIVNEQAREILKVNTQLEKLEVDFKEPFKQFGFPLPKVSVNAGFEGITADCKNKRLYVAQERSPRAIIEIDLNTNKVLRMFKTKDDKQKYPDYADLHFFNGYLYILERNSYSILKFSLKENKVIQKYSFLKMDKENSAQDLYNTGEPFGLAEGIAFDETTIYISFDNNKSPLYKPIRKKYNAGKKVSSILTYKRPKGF